MESIDLGGEDSSEFEFEQSQIVRRHHYDDKSSHFHSNGNTLNSINENGDDPKLVDFKSEEDGLKKKHRQRRHHQDKSGKTDGVGSEKVKVIVRCRPLSNKERSQGHTSIVRVSSDRREIEVHRPSTTSSKNAKIDKTFTFDAIYDERTKQYDLYEEVFRDLVDSVLDGFNGTIFAYGQTGTGKTYTMEGIREISDEQGVIPNAFKHIFDRINQSPDLTYLVRASYLEIYQEEIKDLLNSKLKICELKENSDGVYVKGLSTFLCRDFEEINQLMSKGNKNRSTGATNMNEHSSRSHAIFMIAVEMSETWADGESHVKVGRLNLVDLAGSERQGKTGAEGDRLREAVKINLSLSALGNVIGALADGSGGHVPYRDSKLTRLLQDSLGGNSRTIMVATVGPASFNFDETMVTLRYASRAKRIKNKPKINEDPKDAMLRNYQQEIAKLRALLDSKLHQQRDMVSLDESGDSARQRRRQHGTENKSADSYNETHVLTELVPYLENYGLHRHNDPHEILRILEEKKKALLLDTETVKDEKEGLIKKLESTHSKVQQAETECLQLHDKIEWLESKMLNSGKTLLDHTNEQQKLIEQRQKELDEEKAKEDEMRQKLVEHDLTVTELRDLQYRVEADTQYEEKRLTKFHMKIDRVRDGKTEISKKHEVEVGKCQRYLLQLQKDVQMNRNVLDNFVPSKPRYLMESLTHHNPTDDTFTFLPITSITLRRPMVNRMMLLPLYSKIFDGMIQPMEDIHYDDENILQIGPLPLIRLTRHYVPPETDPHIRSIIQRALADAEKDVVIDCKRTNQTKRRATTARVRLGEIIPYENNLNIRQVLSARHRSREIPYKDFVAVTKSNMSREKSALPPQRNRRANHISLSPDFLFFSPPSQVNSFPQSPSSPTLNHQPPTTFLNYPFDLDIVQLPPVVRPIRNTSGGTRRDPAQCRTNCYPGTHKFKRTARHSFSNDQISSNISMSPPPGFDRRPKSNFCSSILNTPPPPPPDKLLVDTDLWSNTRRKSLPSSFSTTIHQSQISPIVPNPRSNISFRPCRHLTKSKLSYLPISYRLFPDEVDKILNS